MSKFKFIIVILIYLSSHNFFNPLGVVSPQLGKAFFYGFSFIGICLALKSDKRNSLAYPKKAYWWVIVGILVSVFSVWIVYNQPFNISLMTTLPQIFAYLYFWILLKLAPDRRQLFKFVVIMCICSFVMYLVNIFTVPNIIFGAVEESYDDSRGVIRLAVPMIELIVLFLFYSLNQWITTGNKKWFVAIAMTGFLIVMSVVRQIIILSFIFSFLMVMQRSKLWKKIIVLICVWLFASYVLPEIPIYKSLMEVSEDQVDRNKYEEEDIRLTAWRFYTVEYQKNFVTQIIGNGVPSIGNSERGNNFDKTTSYDYGGNGCFYVDVGWAGFYWLFGIFATVGLACLLIKAMRISLDARQLYLFYWFLFILISSITSAPIIFAGQVVSLCICLYLVFTNKNERKKIHSINHPQL